MMSIERDAGGAACEKVAAVDRRRGKPWVLYLLGILIVALCLVVVAAWWLRDVSRDSGSGTNMALLAAGLFEYQLRSGGLPETLSPLRESGAFGLKQRMPMDENGDFGFPGQRIRYLRATLPGYVIAVDVVPLRSGRILYIVSGDSSVHQTDGETLSEMLAEDDEKRKANGQPVGWAAGSDQVY